VCVLRSRIFVVVAAGFGFLFRRRLFSIFFDLFESLVCVCVLRSRIFVVVAAGFGFLFRRRVYSPFFLIYSNH